MPPGFSFYLLDHVIDEMRVLKLGTEHDNIRVYIDFYLVSGWPVKQIIRVDCRLRSFRVGRGKLATQDKTPARALAIVALQALK